MNHTNVENEVQRLQCHNAASMVVDALIMAGIVSETDAEQAVGIVEEELIVRKAMNKL